MYESSNGTIEEGAKVIRKKKEEEERGKEQKMQKQNQVKGGALFGNTST